jgi:elongation factor Ts
MAEITAAMVKDLREKTGAGMMDCKKALTETQGDFAAAEDWLRKKGAVKAASKGTRVAAEGLIGLEVAGTVAALVELNCETDFVAKNPDFQALLKKLTGHVLKAAPTHVRVEDGPAGDGGTALLEQSLEGKKVKDLLTESVAKIGENISVRRFARFDGVVGAYLHANNRVASLVELTTAGSGDDVTVLAKELALQVTGAKPQWVSRDEVPAAALDREKEIFKSELLAAKKPEAIWEKIITGKLEKFYSDNCLVDQIWIKDDKKKMKQVIAETAKKVGQEISIKRLVRFEVGEGIEKKKDDLAAEVAKTIGETAKP